MKRLEFLLLLVLADGPLHGYGLVQRIAEESDQRVQLVPGNLYPVIQRLAQAGLLVESDRRPAPDLDDRRRRYYEITADGRAAVTSEAERMAELVAAANRRQLLDRPSEGSR